MSHCQLPPERLTRVTDLLEIAGRLSPSTAVLPGGHRVEDLRLVEAARDHGCVDRIILVGQKDRMAAAVKEAGIDVASDDMIAADGDEQIAAATIEVLKAGGVDIVLKGDIATPVMNRHILPLAVRPTVSLAAVFDAAPIADGRPMLLTDAGVTTVCDLQRMTDLICNAVDVAQAVMGIERPRVAILSANEKQVASLPSTRMGLELAGQRWQDAMVCGPLSFDLATDPASVAVKGMPDLPGEDRRTLWDQENLETSNPEMCRWVFRARVLDRAGALTSIASAFSNEGVSIDTIVGHGFEECAGVDGSVVLTFYCSEAEKDKMVRKVKRLSKVIQLEEHPYESQSLRKSALILCNRQLKPCDVVGKTAFLTSELVKNDAHGWTYLLAGSPSDLDPVLERLEADGIVKDVIYSVLSL